MNKRLMGHTCSPEKTAIKSLSMHFSLLVAMFLPIYILVAIAATQIQRFGLNAYIL